MPGVSAQLLLSTLHTRRPALVRAHRTAPWTGWGFRVHARARGAAEGMGSSPSTAPGFLHLCGQVVEGQPFSGCKKALHEAGAESRQPGWGNQSAP